MQWFIYLFIKRHRNRENNFFYHEKCDVRSVPKYPLIFLFDIGRFSFVIAMLTSSHLGSREMDLDELKHFLFFTRNSGHWSFAKRKREKWYSSRRETFFFERRRYNDFFTKKKRGASRRIWRVASLARFGTRSKEPREREEHFVYFSFSFFLFSIFLYFSLCTYFVMGKAWWEILWPR